MVKKAKKRGLKRGRKPGVKVGPYRKKNKKIEPENFGTEGTKIGNTLKIRLPNDWAFANVTPTVPEKSKSFADCIFEIVNSNMDQQTKLAAFKAMEEAAKTEVVKAY